MSLLQKVLFLFAFQLSALAIAGDVSVTCTDKEDKDRGEGFWRSRAAVSIDSALITYQGVHKKDSRLLIQEKYADRLLGLSMPQKNNGWCLESFIKVMVNVEGKDFDGTGLYILKECRLLEEGKCAMLDFIWPLSENSTLKGKEQSSLAMRVLRDPAWKNWLFMQINLSAGTSDFIRTLKIGCYPSRTSGRPERERWVLVPNGHYKLDNNWSSPRSLPTEAGAIVYHNKYQQLYDGCFLVYEPDEVEKVTVVGTYGVDTRITLKPGKKTAVLAFGYFEDTPWEDAGRIFFNETLSQVSTQLNRIEWTPVLPIAEFDSLFARTAKLLSETAPWPENVATVSQDDILARKVRMKHFLEIKTTYEKLKSENSLDGILSAVKEVNALKKKFIEDSLKILE